MASTIRGGGEDIWTKKLCVYYVFYDTKSILFAKPVLTEDAVNVEFEEVSKISSGEVKEGAAVAVLLSDEISIIASTEPGLLKIYE